MCFKIRVVFRLSELSCDPNHIGMSVNTILFSQYEMQLLQIIATL